MADRNANQGNQSNPYDSDWERNRFQQENNRQRQQYNNTAYGGNQYRGMNQGNNRMESGLPLENQDQYNRVNYMPDNDQNHRVHHRDYESTPYGTSGTYGYKASGMDYNPGGYGSEGEGSYGNAGYNNWNREAAHQSFYNSNNRNEGNWNRGNRQQSSAGTWGNDEGRQGWDGRYAAGDNNWQGQRGEYAYNNLGNYNSDNNRYNGDTRDYGNTNEGGAANNWWRETKRDVNDWFDNDNNRGDYGAHRGKGPANYRRSENRIREDICDRLTDDDRVDASDILVQIENDVVILSGTVSSRNEKRRAEDLVESVLGVRNVENRLHVGQNVLKTHEYTGNTDNAGGIGNESGTTNEIIRDVQDAKESGTKKGRTRTS